MVVSLKKIKKLGAGQFGEVWLSKDTGLNTEVAVKYIHPSDVQNPNNLFQEAQTLKATEHPNVVHVESTGELQDGKVYIAMEYLKDGSVGEKIKTTHLDLVFAKKIMIDALRGLEYAHSKNILHRDIKPANILIGTSGEGKLSDFGLAIPDGTQPFTDEAYFSHLAPEVYSNNTFSVLSDIYACGVTLYRLVNGDSYLPKLPFSQTMDACIQGKYPDRRKYRLFITKPLKILVNKAMSVNSDDRYQTAQEMRHALERIAIRASWSENTGSNFTQWCCNKPNICYEVTQVKFATNQWNIIIKKGKPKKPLRKISCMCQTRLSKADANKATKRVLQDIVLGKRI